MSIDIRVKFTNRFTENSVFKIKDYACAVIDVIRATSSIAAIFGEGAKSVIIAKNKKEALEYKKKHRKHYLCGEVGGHPPKGFQFGNSPLEFSNARLDSKDLILMTTNGTVSFFKAKKAKIAVSLSLLNFDVVLDYLVEFAQSNGCGILFLCSGEKGEIAFDDVFVAGLAIKDLLRKPRSFAFSDSAKLAVNSVLLESDILGAIEKSTSANSLKSVGLGEDIAFCAEKNKYQVIPVLKHRRNRLELENIYSEHIPT